MTPVEAESLDCGQALKAVQARVKDELERLLPKADELAGRVHEAMRYSVFGRAKRVRPALCLWATEACGGALERALPMAAALEMVHVYSLIHDDLPAMDDDDFRRGRPSCHKAYDEATAILAGDALLTEAFAVIAGQYADDATLVRDLVTLLAKASGSRGMVGGQVLDMALMSFEAGATEQAVAALERLHSLKTGALLRASVMAGARLAQATPEQAQALERYGRAVGLAFQVTDDLLDCTQSSEVLGKTSGKDEAQGKLTYPSLLGLEGSREKARALLEEALEALAVFDRKADALRGLARFIVERST